MLTPIIAVLLLTSIRTAHIEWSTQLPKNTPGATFTNHICSVIKNPFLQNLVLEGVVLYNNKKSLVVPDKCGQEWQIHGTCCELKSLTQYLKNNLKIMGALSDSFITDANQMLKSVETGVNKIIQSSSSITKDAKAGEKTAPKSHDKRLLSESPISKTADKPAEDKQSAETTPKQPPKLTLLSERIKQNLPASGKSGLLFQLDKMMNKTKAILFRNQEIKAAQSKCLAELEIVRQAAICGVCSGRTEVFFKDNSSIQLGLGDCQTVIEHCHNYWVYLVDILDEMLAVEGVLKSAGKSAGNALEDEDRFKSSEHEKLIDWLQQNNLREYLRECKQRSTCSPAAASDICSAFITIQKPDNLARSAKDNLKKQIVEALQLGQVNASSLIKKQDKPEDHKEDPKHHKTPKSNFEETNPTSKKLRLLQTSSEFPTLTDPISSSPIQSSLFGSEVTVPTLNYASNIQASDPASQVIILNPAPSFI